VRVCVCACVRVLRLVCVRGGGDVGEREMFLGASVYVGLYARMHLGVSKKHSCVYLCACVHGYYPCIYSCMLVWLVEIFHKSIHVHMRACMHV